jgi:hypothetical protein
MNAASNVVRSHQHGPRLIDNSGEILNLSKRTAIPLYRSAEPQRARANASHAAGERKLMRPEPDTGAIA